MMPPATPDAERTPPTSTGSRRPRRWRRGPDAPPPIPTLDAAEAAQAVRRAAATPVVRPEPAAPAAAMAAERVIALAMASGMGTPVVPAHGDVDRHRRPERPTPPPRLEPLALEPDDTAERPRHARDQLGETHRTLSLAAAQTARAEAVAQEQAAQARNEAVRRRAAEQLATESAEQVALAHAERVRVEVAAKRHHEEAVRAAEARVAAERAAKDSAQRAAAAEERAQELAASLADTRRQLLEQTRTILDGERDRAEQAAGPAPVEEARIPVVTQPEPESAPEPGPSSEPAPVPEPTPAPERAPAPAPTAEPTSEPEPDARIWPEGADETVRFRSRNSGAVLAVVLGLLALAAAGVTVYQAYRDLLTTTEGIVPAVVTVVLVIALGRTKSTSSALWLTQGVLHVETDDAHREFDLSNRQTLVQMIGKPGERRWKILLLRKGKPAYEIDRSMVDPQELTRVLRRWRPEL